MLNVKVCPICGSSAYMQMELGDGYSIAHIRCGNCDNAHESLPRSNQDQAVDEAVAKWEAYTGKNSSVFDHMLLGRLKADCEYFLGFGNRYEKHLWAKNVKDHIAKMKEIFTAMPENMKPDWLTMDDILEYEKKMS